MKRLVLCCDGTWNRADQTSNGTPCPTNVVKLAYRIAKRDGDIPQVIFYHQGVGTGNLVDRLSGGAFGHGLEENIYDAYRFLIANYEPGDEIYMFGFSRGAFTARSISGIIRKCGILERSVAQEYPRALQIYKEPGIRPDDPKAREFKKSYSCCPDGDVKIRFIGVWDTVGALGIPMRGLRGLTRKKYSFHDTELSGTVEYAYHALAIDEHREPFTPTLWLEKQKPNQTVEQVWFPGVHSDIGGGYPETMLSDIPLDWMLQKAAGVGLALHDKAMASHPLSPTPTGMMHNSKKGWTGLMPGIDRAIGIGGTQSVHQSAIDRWDNDAGYRPKGLKKYFETIGDARGRRG